MKLFWGHFAVDFAVNFNHGCLRAAPQAGHFLEFKLMVGGGFSRPNSEGLFYFLRQLIAALHMTGGALADPNLIFPRFFEAKLGIK